MPDEPRSNESANLDLLRSVAVGLVFFGHIVLVRTGGGRGDVAWLAGRLGVLLFFVHTCLVLMWSLERNPRVVDFYLRRAFRIYPLAIVCVLFAFAFDARWDHASLWANLTLTQNLVHGEVPATITPMWSLPIELQMYAFLPALFFVLRRSHIAWTFAAWCLSLAAAMLTATWGERFDLIRFAPCFLGGVVAWRLARAGVVPRLPGWLWPLAIAGLSLAWLLGSPSTSPVYGGVLGLALGACVPLFREVPWTAVRKASSVVARYSYGVYLSHFALVSFVFGSPWPPMFRHLVGLQVEILQHWSRLGRVCLFSALSVVCPFVLYHLVEAPGIRLGRRLARRVVRPARVELAHPAYQAR